jgi:hypothetical protein
MPMKIKVVVIDLEISPRAKRIALRVGLPLLVLGIASAAYGSVPITFSAGSTLHAADLNYNFAALDARITKLENAPKALHFAQAIIAADGTLFERNNNVSSDLSVTKTGTGTYHVIWRPADFPNGSTPIVTPSLNTPEVMQISGFTESASVDDMYVVTRTTAGVATDGWFSVLIVGM